MKEKVKFSAQDKILRMVMVALFCALSYAVTLLFRINVTFLTFDIKDCMITIGGLLFGPWAAVSVSAVTALLEAITVGDTGFYGLLMDFVSSASFAVVASAIFCMTAIMLGMNLLIVPLYTPGVDVATVAKMLPTLILPFNLTKAVLNAALVLILYKPVSTALRYARVKLPGGSQPAAPIKGSWRTNLLITLAGALLVAASLILFCVFLGGQIDWFVKPGT